MRKTISAGASGEKGLAPGHSAALLGMIFEEQIGISLSVVGCIGVILLILIKVITEKEALASIDLKTIFLFGGTLSLAEALESTFAITVLFGMPCVILSTTVCPGRQNSEA